MGAARPVISAGQIVAAGVLTAIVVAAAAAVVGWPRHLIAVAAVGTLACIIAWRALSNALALNADLIPAVSLGDAGCLLAGALVPAAVCLTCAVPGRPRWGPAAAGALAGFVVNVVIL